MTAGFLSCAPLSLRLWAGLAWARDGRQVASVGARRGSTQANTRWCGPPDMAVGIGEEPAIDRLGCGRSTEQRRHAPTGEVERGRGSCTGTGFASLSNLDQHLPGRALFAGLPFRQNGVVIDWPLLDCCYRLQHHATRRSDSVAAPAPPGNLAVMAGARIGDFGGQAGRRPTNRSKGAHRLRREHQTDRARAST